VNPPRPLAILAALDAAAKVSVDLAAALAKAGLGQ